MKRILVLSALFVVAFAPSAFASNPNHPTGCHGANNVPCRPDPQPTHGNDCEHSDDHSCLTTTTTTVPLSSTTSTLATPTTTTIVPVVSTSPTTSTTALPTTVTTTTAPLSTTTVGGLSGTSALAPAASTSPDAQLAETGFASKALVLLGLWFVIGGLVAIVVGKSIKASSR